MKPSLKAVTKPAKNEKTCEFRIAKISLVSHQNLLDFIFRKEKCDVIKIEFASQRTKTN